MQSSQHKTLAPGDLILVTGVNGYIASHVADQLLNLGYSVRGTARDQEKVDTIGQTLLERNPSGSFKGVVVKDMTKPGAFDEAVAGVAGIMHIATDVSFSPNPNDVVPQVVQATRSLLEAAAKTSTVKQFVYTSSSIAAVHPTPNEKFLVDSSSWNETDLRDAWAPEPYLPSRAFAVYGASKVEAERAAWSFMKTEQPSFVFNTILPNFAIGPRLHKSQPGSTSGWLRGLYNGEEEGTEFMRTFPPQWAVDVRDIARIHVAAMLEPDVQSERLFAFAEPYNYSKVLRILREIDPARQNYPPPEENEGEDLSEVDTARAEELLKRMGAPGFNGMEEAIRAQLQAE